MNLPGQALLNLFADFEELVKGHCTGQSSWICPPISPTTPWLRMRDVFTLLAWQAKHVWQMLWAPGARQVGGLRNDCKRPQGAERGTPLTEAPKPTPLAFLHAYRNL